MLGQNRPSDLNEVVTALYGSSELLKQNINLRLHPDCVNHQFYTVYETSCYDDMIGG